MKILHISDTHGTLPVPEGDFDVVVHSGDMMPNRSFGQRPIENTFQRHWIEEHAPKFHHRYWGVPFLYVPGNHDYVDPTTTMRELGIDARLLCNGSLDVKGVTFYGFPWTPTFYEWAWMCGRIEMKHHLSPAVELLEQGAIDVFVSHGPMYGVLDRNREGERCGCKDLRRTMQTVRHPPKALLHGHIHEANGGLKWGPTEMAVSNAATTQRIVALDGLGEDK